jgi:hypothetical protein
MVYMCRFVVSRLYYLGYIAEIVYYNPRYKSLPFGTLLLSCGRMYTKIQQ